ncbi:MAG TPA: nuclear transport factor 2 family protein [Solirubrobacteraceae bacterium]|jgi:nuclear transport factor 2 (NTF2) superfamily protein|nr:nuclear transport factor 2 family protein [Solirubrobacteraceae bacterium]
MVAGVAFLESFCTRWLQAWNSHDTEQVLAVTHPEIQWDDRTFWPEVIHGHEALRAYTEEIWRAMPDVRFDEIERFYAPSAQRAVVLFRQFGSAPAKLGSGGRFDSHGCDIFLGFRDGLLSSYLSSYDIVEMLRQMEALPARGSRLGGAYLMALAGARAAS